MEQSVTDFIASAWKGPNAALYVALNIIAIFAHRYSGVSTQRLFTLAGIAGGLLGGWRAFIEALATSGVATTTLGDAVVVGTITGCASALVIGYALSAGADKLGILPISDAKTTAEKIRDPMDPTQPPRSNG